jgi:hypothetical protein
MLFPDAIYDEILYNETESEVDQYDYGILPTDLRLNHTYYQVKLIDRTLHRSEANPTTSIYNAIVVKIYKATNSLARF